MDISITGPAATMNKRFQKAARRRLVRAFGNYSSSIVCITAELSDQHSGEDGLQRHCRIVMHLLGFEVVTSDAWDENPLAAVIRAADRARQMMISQMTRPWRQVVGCCGQCSHDNRKHCSIQTPQEETMHISITGPAEIRSQGFRDSVTSRLMRALSRFSRRIARVDVAITDENGPRGGIDKHCRIRVWIPGIDPLVATATDASPRDAVNGAATRTRRKVITMLKRRRSQRERRRQARGADSISLDL